MVPLDDGRVKRAERIPKSEVAQPTGWSAHVVTPTSVETSGDNRFAGRTHYCASNKLIP